FGRLVEFLYWGEHEIYTRFSEEKHAGRNKFWFDQEFLSQAWFEKHLQEVVANAGERYTPEVNVQLPIAQVFDGLGRTSNLFAEVDSIHKEIRKAFGFVSSRKLGEAAPALLRELQGRLPELFSTLAGMHSQGWSLLPLTDLATIQTKATQE